MSLYPDKFIDVGNFSFTLSRSPVDKSQRLTRLGIQIMQDLADSHNMRQLVWAVYDILSNEGNSSGTGKGLRLRNTFLQLKLLLPVPWSAKSSKTTESYHEAMKNAVEPCDRGKAVASSWPPWSEMKCFGRTAAFRGAFGRLSKNTDHTIPITPEHLVQR
jgi:hypothetical protein